MVLATGGVENHVTGTELDLLGAVRALNGERPTIVFVRFTQK